MGINFSTNQKQHLSYKKFYNILKQVLHENTTAVTKAKIIILADNELAPETWPAVVPVEEVVEGGVGEAEEVLGEEVDVEEEVVEAEEEGRDEKEDEGVEEEGEVEEVDAEEREEGVRVAWGREALGEGAGEGPVVY